MTQPRRRNCLLSCLALLATTFAPLRSVRADVPTTASTVAIELRAGHVWVDGTLNGQPAHFILDTGAGAMLVTPEAAQRCGLPLEKGKATVQGAIAVGVQKTIAASIGVGEAQLQNQEAYVAALPEQLAGCDGFLGYPFLARFVVTIDYEKQLGTIGGDGTPSIAPPKPPASAPSGAWLPLTFEGNTPIIDGAVDGNPVRLRVDSGDDGAAMLLAPYVTSHKLRENLTPRLTTITGRGIGGFLRGDIVRVPTLTVGAAKDAKEALTLHRVITELSRQTAGGFYSQKFSGQIGAEVLERFTVTFDYPHHRVRFVPNDAFAAPFGYNRAGLNIDLQRGRFHVVDVIPDSPAAEVGFVTGDEILAFDGIAASDLTAVELHDKVRQPAGTTIKVRRQHKGAEPDEVTLVLRDLL